MNPLTAAWCSRARFLVPFLAVAATSSALADTPPSLASEPEFRSVASGASLVLAPTLTGDPVTSCQWFKDGAPLVGATSATYSIPSVAAASTGYYTATFTNAAGSTQAAVAVVQVDGAAVAPDTSAASYRLSDYFNPRIVGAEWLYSGVEQGSGQTIYTRMHLADLARAVTCYTGRYEPQSYQVSTVSMNCDYGSYANNVFTSVASWSDYWTVAPGGITRCGGDTWTGGTDSYRFDGAARYPAAMRLGQTNEQAIDYYEHGRFVGPATMVVQLVAVETVDTPAGRFHGCPRLRSTVVAPTFTQVLDQWWVAGLGLVRQRWVSGYGIPMDSKLVSYQAPAAARYNLAEHFVSPVAGSVFNSTGLSAGGSVSNTVTTITGTDMTITTYHGTGFPATPANQQVVADQNVSTATDGTVQETWKEYLTTAGGVVYWGVDNPATAGTIRFENGVAFPIDMAVGETTTISRNAYLAGFYVGSGSMAVQLLGVENCTVPAGTFANSLHLQFTLTAAGQSESYEMWAAPDVGCVRYKAVTGGGQRERNLVSWAVPRAPALSDQSTLVTCALGGTARLNVLAVGTGPLSFQWYRGESGDVSTPIANATSYAFTTPALTAWTRYWVRVTNVVGSIDSATMLVMPTGGTNTLADWSLLDGIPANQRGSLNTPAGDNAPNLLKFALGLTPTASATLSLPRAVIVAGTAAGDTNKYLGLEFARNAGAQGITLVLEVSADLVKWDEVTSSLTTIGTAADGRQNVRLRETAALATATRRFARLKVVTTP
jgi:hypothetical protein